MRIDNILKQSKAKIKAEYKEKKLVPSGSIDITQMIELAMVEVKYLEVEQLKKANKLKEKELELLKESTN